METIYRSADYFELRIQELYQGIDKFSNWIKTGKTPPERINIVKRAIVWDYVSIINCKASLKKHPQEFKEDILKAIEIIYESWDGFWKLKNQDGVALNQYILSAYDEMLWILSLGCLLDIPEADFKKLVDVIDRDGVKDYLFEFIIRAKLKDRKLISEESYREYFDIPKIFEKLRQAIIEVDKTKAEKLVREFIIKDWYKSHKDAGWYNSHKSPHNTYFGYWSFETAAVVKIIGLDDSGFIDCQYYPKDMIVK